MLGQNELASSFQLSPQQQRLCALQQDESSSVYHVRCAVLIEGRLVTQFLLRAVQDVIDQHEILRTAFARNEAGIIGQISPERGHLALEELDLDSLPQAEQEECINALFEEMGQLRFDLKQLPLLQLRLLRLSDVESVLLLSQPALCADLHSLTSLIHEIGLQYAAHLHGREHLSEPMQYADFSEWQNELLEMEEGQAGRAFWSKQFDRPFLKIKLPHERSNMRDDLFVPERVGFQVSAENVEALEALAARYRTSLQVVLLTCWQVLLARFTAQPQIVVGVAYDGRNYEALQDALGLFTRYLPIQTQLDDDCRFAECLARVAEVAEGLSQWQEYFSWGQIPVEENGAGDLPFFPFSFDFISFDDSLAHFAGLSCSMESWYACLERFKVKLSCVRTAHSLFSDIHYDCALFERPQIELLTRAFETVLESVLADPEAMLCRLEVLSESDRRQLLIEFNETDADHPVAICMHQLFEAHVENAPNQAAVIFDRQQLTYEELNKRANRLAHYLQALGVGPEVLVGICIERSVEMLIGLLGILKAGGAFVPLDPTYPLERLSLMLEDSQVPVIVTQEQLLERLPTCWAQVVCIDADSALIEAQSDENPSSAVVSQDAAYVIYTSGTTGKPKGVVIEHRGVANLACWQAHNFNISRGSRISQFASYSFDAAVGETCMALLNGATLVMLNREELDPAELIAALDKHSISVCVLVPSLIKELDTELLTHSEQLTMVAVGEACPPELALKWSRKCCFVNAYGPTEYTIYSHCWKVDVEFLREADSVPVGRPIHNTKSYILDQRLKPVPAGVIGELYISGPGLARGYLNRPELTAERFLPSGFADHQASTEHGLLLINSVAAEREEFKEQKRRQQHLLDGNRRQRNISSAEVLQLVAALDADLVEKTRAFVQNYRDENAAYEGFCRYLMEGANESYASCGINQDVLRRLLPHASFKGLQGVDFGFGNMEVLQTLSQAGAHMKGLDLNPFFVQKGRNCGFDVRMAKIDIAPEMFASESQIEEGSQDFAISTLLLDRLQQPGNSLQNLMLLLKEGGRFAIQTLLPIIGEDDGETDNPIIYTPERERLTPGQSVEQDKLAMISILRRYGAEDINLYQLPYVVSSRDGIQEYTVWSFSGRKKKKEVAAADYFGTMYKTGDLARYLPDGNIEFRGRVDNQVKIRGFRVELGDIETALLSSQKVKDCVVIAEDKQGTERLVAYVVPANQETLPSSELQSYLKQKLPEYMIPHVFVTMASLPLTANGKIDRRALPAPASINTQSTALRRLPETAAEQLLAEIWRGVLRLEKIWVEDNFFELGGDSILSIQIVARANRAGLQFSPKQLFQYPNIEQLARVAKLENAVMEAEQELITGTVELTPVQHWFFESKMFNRNYYNQAVMLKVKPSTDLALLKQTIAHLLLHHDALRLRFRESVGGWEADNDGEPELSFETVNMSHIKEQKLRRSVIEAEAELVQASLNLSAGPLMRAVYFDCGSEESGRLLLVIHHLAVDGVSWRILLEDLQRGYQQLSAGESIELGAKTTSFKQWAALLKQQAQSEQVRAQMDYWSSQSWQQAVSLPGEAGLGELRNSSLQTISETLSGEQTSALLQEVPEAYHTQIMEVLLTALGRALGQWIGEGAVVVDAEGHGREEIVEGVDLSRTVGWFTAIFPVLLRTSASEETGEGLKRVKEQLRGIPQKGIGYGMLRYLSEDESVRRRMRRIPSASLSFNYLGQFDQMFSDSWLQAAEEQGGKVQGEHERMRYPLQVNSLMRAGKLETHWTYSRDTYEEETIKRIAESYQQSLEEIISHCASSVGGFTPSDFPEANLSQSELDAFISRIMPNVGE